MTSEQQIADFVATLDGVTTEHVADQHLAYKVGVDGEERIFALVEVGSKPLKVHAKCDYKLSKKLRLDYETVLPSRLMHPRDWNVLICSGQLTDDEVFDLVRLSYILVKG